MPELEEKTVPSEVEIMAHWDGDAEIAVSVVCTTFNQVAFIEEAIQGFLQQKTRFPFEVIIHDDASTDGASEIIARYARGYPKLIRAVLQTENQFSKGGFRPTAYAATFAAGRYIALCEGDDYWVAEDKLQRQFDALESHGEIGLCVHDARCIDDKGGDSLYEFPRWSSKDAVVAYEHVFKSTGQFAPTASMFLRTAVFRQLPSFFYQAPIGDFFLEAFSGTNGVFYFPEKMSVYRRGSSGAWSATVLEDVAQKITFDQSMLTALSELREYVAPINRRLVKYKEQQIYFDLTRAYLGNGERIKSLEAWLMCLSGAPKLGWHLGVLMMQAGLRQKK